MHAKFNPDGSPRLFAGNTIISPIEPRSTESGLLERALGAAAHGIAADFAVLPPSSWHMTVFELLCDQVRDPAYWSPLVDGAAPMTVVDEVLAARVRTVEAPALLTMQCSDLCVGSGTLGLQLIPADTLTGDVLSQYRNDVSAATGIRFPNHEQYGFHITLAYELTVPPPSAQTRIDQSIDGIKGVLTGALFEMQQPVMTYFADMTEFSVLGRPTRTV